MQKESIHVKLSDKSKEKTKEVDKSIVERKQKKEVNGEERQSDTAAVLRWMTLASPVFLIWSLNRVSKLSTVTTNS